MKLIKKGKRAKQLFRGECRGCGSAYQAERSELNVHSGDLREPGEWAQKKCPSPGCPQDITFYPYNGAFWAGPGW
jgi:hypothetical protein